MQIYLDALKAAYNRHASSVTDVLDLSKRVASAYSGFVPQASKAVAAIAHAGVSYAFEVIFHNHCAVPLMVESFIQRTRSFIEGILFDFLALQDCKHAKIKGSL